MGKQHGELISEIIDNVNRSGGAWCWRSQTGVFKSLDGARTVSVGLKGSADITGILRTGIRLEIEVKVNKDKQRIKQQQFQASIEALGGKYKLVKTVEEALGFVQECLRKA